MSTHCSETSDGFSFHSVQNSETNSNSDLYDPTQMDPIDSAIYTHTHTLFRIPPQFIHSSPTAQASSLMSSSNWGGFTSFPVWMPFTSSFGLTKPSITVLSRSASRHSSLAPDVFGKISHLSTLSMMLAVGFYRCLLIRLKKFCFIPSLLRAFIMKEYWVFFSNAFSATIEITMWFLFFILLIWGITLINFHMLNQPCILGVNPLGHFVEFILCGAEFNSILLRTFAFIFSRLWFPSTVFV